jgi:hypothetical protein
MIVKKGNWLKSKKGEEWKIIDIVNKKIVISKYYQGEKVGTIKGVNLKDLEKYFKKIR